MILGAGDDARLVVRRQPHRLRLVELGILKRRQAKQPVSKTRMQVRPWRCRSDCRGPAPTSEAVRRRSAAPFGDATAAPSTAPRSPSSCGGRPHAEDAASSFGVLRRSLRPALGRSCARSRETPTGRPTATKCVIEKDAVALLARVPSAAAGRSGCRILLAASCPDSERAGRTNRGRCPAAPPSSR